MPSVSEDEGGGRGGGDAISKRGRRGLAREEAMPSVSEDEGGGRGGGDAISKRGRRGLARRRGKAMRAAAMRAGAS